VTAPDPAGTPVTLVLDVADTDTTLRQVRAAGGTVQREPYQGYGARMATVIDPAGHRWMLSGPIPTPPSADGALGYVALQVGDVERAVRFYGQVLGWTFDADAGADSGDRRQVSGSAGSVAVERGGGGVLLGYAVADVDAVAERVRRAGGSAGEVRTRPWGRHVDCIGAGGGEFAVFEPSRPPGELGISYLTYRTPDAAAFRQFCGQVFDWTFEPGPVPDGWQIAGAQPMSGVAGGAQRFEAVPMWRVPDVAAAVQRVRAAGGRVLDGPARQPYGTTAECVDDQDRPFYLGDE
jgi:predicted enzyme related to lactoylglutathione lyase